MFVNLEQKITKTIFSFLNDNKKLNIIKNNKNLQQILEINIENYKNMCNRFIIFERDGKGKEYLRKNNILLFEGEYLNGKRNGNGVEYYYNDLENETFLGKIKYEGNYFNGKRNGKGKEYFYNGNLKFDGEYLYGKKNGKGKEYFYNYEKIKFMGEYSNGERNLYGKEFNENGELKYEGEYINGEKIGYGKDFYENSSLKYEGM